MREYSLGGGGGGGGGGSGILFPYSLLRTSKSKLLVVYEG